MGDEDKKYNYYLQKSLQLFWMRNDYVLQRYLILIEDLSEIKKLVFASFFWNDSIVNKILIFIEILKTY